MLLKFKLLIFSAFVITSSTAIAGISYRVKSQNYSVAMTSDKSTQTDESLKENQRKD